MKDKLIAIFIGILVVVLVGGMLFLAIKYTRQYPGYEYQLPPTYSPYPPFTDSCIKNPKWCYGARNS